MVEQFCIRSAVHQRSSTVENAWFWPVHQKRSPDQRFRCDRPDEMTGCGSRTAGDFRTLPRDCVTDDRLDDAIRECAPGYVESVTVASSKLGWAETASGGLVSRQDLFVAALLGNVRRVVNDSVGRVIDLGRTSRLFTGAAREAILLGGDRCSFPGDEFRPGRIHIDHLIPWVPRHPWEDRGRTDHDNGGPLCAGHDTAKHDLGITTTRDRTGWHFHRSDGTEIAPRGPDPNTAVADAVGAGSGTIASTDASAVEQRSGDDQVA